jgi:hypothetical protein
LIDLLGQKTKRASVPEHREALELRRHGGLSRRLSEGYVWTSAAHLKTAYTGSMRLRVSILFQIVGGAISGQPGIDRWSTP